MSLHSPAVLERLHAQADDPARQVLITGAHVVSMDADQGPSRADVLVVGDTIAAVGPDLTARASGDAVVVDATGSVLIPGLVDSHVHAWEGQLRGSAPSADFAAYMSLTHGGVAAHMTPEDVAIGQRITAAQAINAGVTTIVDNSHNSRTPEHSDAAVEALLGAGIRAVHAVGAPLGADTTPHLPQDVLRLRDQYADGAGGLLNLRLFDAAPTVESWSFARDHGLDVVAEMGIWVPDLDDLLASGLSDPGHTYNHCAGLTPEQWDRIAASGAAVNVAPRSDPHFGLGAFVPVLEAQRRGVQVGISSDNEISYGYDLFTEMRVLLTVQRGLAFQAAFGGDEDAPAPFTPYDALRTATVGGAANAGLADHVGSITPGKKADLVLLDLRPVHTTPHGELVGTVVSWLNTSNVSAVLVGGRVRKWSGRLVGIDYASWAEAGESSRRRLWEAVGLSVDDVLLGRVELAST